MHSIYKCIVYAFICYKNNKNILKMKEYARRDIKPEKAQKQDWDGTLTTTFN